MKIDSLANLFYSRAQSAQNSAGNNQTATTKSESSEAVKIAVSAPSRAPSDVVTPDRQAKVDRLKREVQDGRYAPDIRKVAEALMRDLFM